MKNSYFSFPSERRQQRVQNLPCGLIPFIIVYVLYCGYRLVVGHDLAMVETGVRFPYPHRLSVAKAVRIGAHLCEAKGARIEARLRYFGVRSANKISNRGTVSVRNDSPYPHMNKKVPMRTSLFLEFRIRNELQRDDLLSMFSCYETEHLFEGDGMSERTCIVLYNHKTINL